MVYICVIDITITDDMQRFPHEVSVTIINYIIPHTVLLVCVLVLGLCGSNDNTVYVVIFE